MNDENLIPNSERTPSELREMTRKGGIASGIARRKKRDAKQSINLLLGMAAKGNLESTLKNLGFDEADTTNMNALTAKVFMMAMNGNLKAYEKLMEYGGLTPEEKRKERRANAEIAVLKARAADADVSIGGGEDFGEGETDDVRIYVPDNGRRPSP